MPGAGAGQNHQYSAGGERRLMRWGMQEVLSDQLWEHAAQQAFAWKPELADAVRQVRPDAVVVEYGLACALGRHGVN